MRTLTGHTATIFSLKINEQNNSQLLSASKDNTIKLWSLLNGECLLTLNDHTDSVSVLAQSKEGLLISGSFDNTIRVWNLTDINNNHHPLRVLEGHTDWIVALLVVKKSNLIISGSNDQSIRFWNLESGECLRVIKNAHSISNNGVSSLSFALSNDETKLISASSSDRFLKIWNVSNAQMIRSFKLDDDNEALTTDNNLSELHSLKILPKHSQLLGGFSTGLIKRWTLNKDFNSIIIKDRILSHSSSSNVTIASFSINNLFLSSKYGELALTKSNADNSFSLWKIVQNSQTANNLLGSCATRLN